MEKTKTNVTIKGTKDGLVFLLNDSCPLSDVVDELKHKFDHSSASQIWDGPIMNVKIKLGNRRITKREEIQLRKLFGTKKSLAIRGFESSDGESYLSDSYGDMNILSGTVRSGQVVEQKGDLLLLGDVNPGGKIQCTGSIYVLGSLKGYAYAGTNNDDLAIVAASTFNPTQLLIGNIMASPQMWQEEAIGSKFAYISGRDIKVDKLTNFANIQPDKELKYI